MEERIVLKANEGMILTDGSIYGRTIYLAKGVFAESYYEITEEEYQILMSIEEQKILSEVGMI